MEKTCSRKEGERHAQWLWMSLRSLLVEQIKNSVLVRDGVILLDLKKSFVKKTPWAKCVLVLSWLHKGT